MTNAPKGTWHGSKGILIPKSKSCLFVFLL